MWSDVMIIMIYISQKKRRPFGKNSEGALYIIKDNTKTIVIAMNEGEARDDAWYHVIMNGKNARQFKTLELEHQRITSTKKIIRHYIEALMSIGYRYHLISQSFQHWCLIDIFY